MGRKVDLAPLTTAGLAIAVACVFDLDEDQDHALKARVKHMQLLDFPKDGVRKGSRASYSVEDAMRVVVAFALLETGMPSVSVCKLVRDAWSEIADVMTIEEVSTDMVLICEPHALGTVGRHGKNRRAVKERLSVAPFALGNVAPAGAFSATRVVVDLAALARRFREVVIEQELSSSKQFLSRLARLNGRFNEGLRG